MSAFRWGIFGTGAISAKFVQGLAAADHAEASFIASRSPEKARRFAAAFKIGRAIAGYAEAAAEGGVDAVYIATPPSEHATHARLCIDAGIPVLVEKPFASDAASASCVAEAARKRAVFAMEAMWTRFLPATQALRAKLANGVLGETRMISGNFGLSMKPDPASGNFNFTTGGGAIAHLGTYPLSLGQWLFGTPELVQAIGTTGATGVEEDAVFQLRYPSGVLGSFFVSIRAWAPDDFQIMGTEGLIKLRGSIVRPYGLYVTHEVPRTADDLQLGFKARLRQHPFVHRVAQNLNRSSRSRGYNLSYHYSGNGYHYEADEVRACIGRGALESTIMPLSESLAVAATADEIRQAIRKPTAKGPRPA